MTAEHLDEGTVQRVLHDELPDPQTLDVRAHLEQCDECRTLVALARQQEAELFTRFEALDDPMPRLTLDQALSRTSKERHTASIARRVKWRWAAGVLLAIGVSGVAYAAPGSPLRWVVNRISAWIRPPAASRVPEVREPTATVGGGVLMEPGDIAIIELSTRPFDTLRVTLGDGTQIAVRAVGGTVAFDSDVDRLSVSNSAGVASIEVVIPRTAPRVEIVAGGRRLYVKDGSAVTSVATDTTGGRHVILPGGR